MNTTSNSFTLNKEESEKIIRDHAMRLVDISRAITQGELFLLVCLCQAVKQDIKKDTIREAVKPFSTGKTITNYLGVFSGCIC